MFETFLIITGLIIFGLALWQRAKQVRLATIQIACGLVIAILSFFLFRAASISGTYYYESNIYLLGYVVMAGALLVIAVGLLQIFTR
jgi:hypothetical protein